MGSTNIHLRMDNDILDIEVPCYICKDLVMLGNDYRCHLNYAHDIDTKNMDCENDLNKAFQCEICGEAFKGRDVIEAHIDGLHLDIVEELEEDIADFYVHLQAVSTQLNRNLRLLVNTTSMNQ